jgi:glycerol-3-phosphate dehydrogenase
VAAAPKVAELMADILGWDEAEKKREVDAYVGRVAAERKSQTEPDDDTAEAARLDTLDIAVPSQAGQPSRPSQRTKAG